MGRAAWGAFLFVGAALSADPGAEIGPPAFDWPRVENSAFAPGESLTFSIAYGIFPAGTARLEVLPSEEMNGRSVHHLVSSARSHPALDVLFKVRDQNDSWVDAESLCSLRFRQDIREGRYRRKKETVIDPLAGRYVSRRWKKGVESMKQGDTRPFVQDVLSSLYYIRTFPLEVGRTYSLEVHSGVDTWTLNVRVRARERVRVPAGEFDCLRLEPTLAGEGLFNAKGKLTVWVTNDTHRMPVLLKSKVAVGSFAAELTRWTLGGLLPAGAEPSPGAGARSRSHVVDFV